MQTLGNTGDLPLGVTFNIMSEIPGRKVRDTFIFFPTATSKYLGSLQGGSHPHCPPSWLSAARISQHPAAGTAAPGFRPPPLPPPRAHEGLAPAPSASGPPAQQQRCPHPAPRRDPPHTAAPPRARPPGRSPPAPGTHLAGQQRGARLLPPGDPAEDALLPLGAAAARLLPLGPELPGPGPGPGRGLLARHGCSAAAGRLPTAEAGPPRRARGLPLAGTRCAEAALGLGLAWKEKYTSTGAE